MGVLAASKNKESSRWLEAVAQLLGSTYVNSCCCFARAGFNSGGGGGGASALMLLVSWRRLLIINTCNYSTARARAQTLTLEYDANDAHSHKWRIITAVKHVTSLFIVINVSCRLTVSLLFVDVFRWQAPFTALFIWRTQNTRRAGTSSTSLANVSI